VAGIFRTVKILHEPESHSEAVLPTCALFEKMAESTNLKYGLLSKMGEAQALKT